MSDFENVACTQRVRDVLHHLEKQPINIHSEAMFYLPTCDLDSGRLPEVVENLHSDDVVSEWKENKDAQSLHRSRGMLTMSQERAAEVITSLLYLSCKGLDEAHNLVLPFNSAKVDMLEVDPIMAGPMVQEASYCHALVHRKEGEHIGILGRSGWGSACFWFDRSHNSRTRMQNALQRDFWHILQSSEESVQRRVKHVMPHAEKIWDADAFTTLCEVALEKQEKNLIDFCNKVARIEWKMLLHLCYDVLNA